jgi:hypothetical protein
LSIIQAFPFKTELFKLLLDRIETVEVPSLQLYLKIIVNLLSSTNSPHEGNKEKKKAFYSNLTRLVSNLGKVISIYAVDQPYERGGAQIDSLDPRGAEFPRRERVFRNHLAKLQSESEETGPNIRRKEA